MLNPFKEDIHDIIDESQQLIVIIEIINAYRTFRFDNF